MIQTVSKVPILGLVPHRNGRVEEVVAGPAGTHVVVDRGRSVLAAGGRGLHGVIRVAELEIDGKRYVVAVKDLMDALENSTRGGAE